MLSLSIDKNVNLVLRLDLRIMIRKYSIQGDSWEVTSSLVLFLQYKKHQIKGVKNSDSLKKTLLDFFLLRNKYKHLDFDYYHETSSVD